MRISDWSSDVCSSDLGRLTTRGRIVVDAGAERALGKGNSLLPAGVARVEGVFARGAVVDIVTADGQVIARGLIEYDSERTEGRRVGNAGVSTCISRWSR